MYVGCCSDTVLTTSPPPPPTDTRIPSQHPSPPPSSVSINIFGYILAHLLLFSFASARSVLLYRWPPLQTIWPLHDLVHCGLVHPHLGQRWLPGNRLWYISNSGQLPQGKTYLSSILRGGSDHLLEGSYYWTGGRECIVWILTGVMLLVRRWWIHLETIDGRYVNS